MCIKLLELKRPPKQINNLDILERKVMIYKFTLEILNTCKQYLTALTLVLPKYLLTRCIALQFAAFFRALEFLYSVFLSWSVQTWLGRQLLDS